MKKSQCWVTSQSGVCPERPAGLSPGGWTRAVVSPEGHRTREGTEAAPQPWFLREAETPHCLPVSLLWGPGPVKSRQVIGSAASWAAMHEEGAGSRDGGREREGWEWGLGVSRLLWAQLGQWSPGCQVRRGSRSLCWRQTGALSLEGRLWGLRFGGLNSFLARPFDWGQAASPGSAACSG